jgi:hypothetical protein
VVTWREKAEKDETCDDNDNVLKLKTAMILGMKLVAAAILTGVELRRVTIPGMKERMGLMPGMKERMRLMSGMKERTRLMPGLKERMRLMPGMKERMRLMLGMKKRTRLMPGMKKRVMRMSASPGGHHPHCPCHRRDSRPGQLWNLYSARRAPISNLLYIFPRIFTLHMKKFCAILLYTTNYRSR